MQRGRRRVPAVRARHIKRLPEPQLTGPVTFTITTTRNPTPPVIPPPADTSSATSSTPSSGSTPVVPPPVNPPPPPSPPAPPTPVLSVITTGQPTASSNASSENNSSGAVSTRKLPAGAIVGIVIGTVLIMLALVVLIVRSRFRKTRQTRRSTWLAKGGISSNMVTGKTLSSFAPAEKFPQTMSTYPAYPSNLTRPGDTSPGVAFAKAQAQALSSVPIISPPQPTYNNSPVGPTPGMSATTPRAILPVEQATVKFTFIPTLEDELQISNGETIKVLQEFDDGWALCVNQRNQQGMVPLECLDRGDASANGDRLGVPNAGAPRNSNRASSLNILPNRRESGF